MKEGDRCGKQDCEALATKEVWGSMLYKTCDAHYEEIKTLVANE